MLNVNSLTTPCVKNRFSDVIKKKSRPNYMMYTKTLL